MLLLKFQITRPKTKPFTCRYLALLGSPQRLWTDGLYSNRDSSGTAHFNRMWLDYRDGFEKHDENFWIGLEKLYQLTNINQYRLRFELLLENGTWLSAEYNNFTIGDEETKYKIQVDGYSGETGDFFNASAINQVHNGMPFSTWDNDNDRTTANCAFLWGGGWWYNACSWANLNGVSTNQANTSFYVILDETNAQNKKLVTSRMMMKLVWHDVSQQLNNLYGLDHCIS